MKTHKYTMIFAAALSLATACGSTQPGEELEQPPVTPSLPPVEQGDFIQIAGGTFTMGSPSDERWRETDEVQHEVTLGSYLIAKYEVTQDEYTAVTGTNPSHFKGDDLPVDMVSWYDAINYCNALSLREELTPAYTIEGTDVIWNREANVIACRPKPNGNMPAVREQRRRSAPDVILR